MGSWRTCMLVDADADGFYLILGGGVVVLYLCRDTHTHFDTGTSKVAVQLCWRHGDESYLFLQCHVALKIVSSWIHNDDNNDYIHTDLHIYIYTHIHINPHQCPSPKKNAPQKRSNLEPLARLHQLSLNPFFFFFFFSLSETTILPNGHPARLVDNKVFFPSHAEFITPHHHPTPPTYTHTLFPRCGVR